MTSPEKHNNMKDTEWSQSLGKSERSGQSERLERLGKSGRPESLERFGELEGSKSLESADRFENSDGSGNARSGGRRIIFHVDVNSAFLSWSALKQLREDPDSVDLRTIPSAVGGDIKSRRGVITAKSIPAKKYGVVTGEPVVKALQKCPNLVLVRSDFETYRKYSREFTQILMEHSSMVEKVSIDEAYLDMTGTENRYKDRIRAGQPFPLCAAKAIQEEVYEKLGFTVNVGISVNKLLAKMASDFQKPNKIHTLYPEEVPKKMWPLPIRDLYGCGAATSNRLVALGLTTIGDVASMPLSTLQSALGNKTGSWIHQSANGYGSDQVHSEKRKAKSYSNETTLREDLTHQNYQALAPAILDRLCEKVSQRMQKDQVLALTISVSVKSDTFQRFSRQTTLVNATNQKETLLEYASALLEELCLGDQGLFRQGHGIRLIGIGGSHLTKNSYQQRNLFDWAKDLEEIQAQKEEKAKAEKKEKLEQMMEQSRKKFGKDMIHKGFESHR